VDDEYRPANYYCEHWKTNHCFHTGYWVDLDHGHSCNVHSTDQPDYYAVDNEYQGADYHADDNEYQPTDHHCEHREANYCFHTKSCVDVDHDNSCNVHNYNVHSTNQPDYHAIDAKYQPVYKHYKHRTV
jgi:hypothetical protein